MNELAKYQAELKESDRLFGAARRAALEGDRTGANDLLVRALGILDAIEAEILRERAS